MAMRCSSFPFRGVSISHSRMLSMARSLIVFSGRDSAAMALGLGHHRQAGHHLLRPTHGHQAGAGSAGAHLPRGGGAAGAEEAAKPADVSVCVCLFFFFFPSSSFLALLGSGMVSTRLDAPCFLLLFLAWLGLACRWSYVSSHPSQGRLTCALLEEHAFVEQDSGGERRAS